MSSIPAELYKTNSPNWLPTLHMGHSKRSKDKCNDVARYERDKE